MEIIRGKQPSFLQLAAWDTLRRTYQQLHFDLGTGDGRFVQHLASTQPDTLVIGVDACRENLIEASRRAAQNSLFVIANVEQLPSACYGCADRITVNFPWGSLLGGLLARDSAVCEQLTNLTRCGTHLDVTLNASALQEAGWSLDAGTAAVRKALEAHGFRMRAPVTLQASDLKQIPTAWAKRLAYGRMPYATWLQGVQENRQPQQVEKEKELVSI
jgi:hypothetical protein